MKKLLLATTAIVSVAGVASAAEIKLSGYAEIGIDDGDAPGFDTQFHNDFQVDFNFSGETDGGLTFGGSFQLEDNEDSANFGSTQINGTPRIDEEHFYVSGAFGQVTLGETEGAMEWALGYIYSGTSLSDDHSTHAGAYWNTGLDGSYDDQIARYEYSFGDFSVAGSLELDDNNSVAQGSSPTANGDPVYGIGAKWGGTISGVDVAAAVAYQDNSTFQIWGVSGTVALPMGLSITAQYADLDGAVSHYASSNGFSANSDSWYGVGVAYSTGPLLLSANYGAYDTASVDGVARDVTIDGYGFLANYDLGGGAVVMAGYGHSNVPSGVAPGSGSYNGKGEDTWSLGLGLSF